MCYPGPGFPRAEPVTWRTGYCSAIEIRVMALVRILLEIRGAISSYDEQIEAMARQHPDFAVMDSLPGAGAAGPQADRGDGHAVRPLSVRR